MAQSEDLDFQIDGYDPDDLSAPDTRTAPSRPAERASSPERRKKRPATDRPRREQPAQEPEKQSASKQHNSLFAFLNSDGFRLFCGGLLIALSILVVVGFVSYLHSGEADQSEALNKSLPEMAENSNSVKKDRKSVV